MVNLGGFLNEYAVNLHYFLPIVVFAAMSMPVFGHFYNRLMDRLADEREHTSLYVAGGNLVTLAVGAIFSWKAALLFLILFILDGLPMITGEFRRTERKVKALRVKRLPYKANAFIDDIEMAANESRRMLNSTFKSKNDAERAIKLAGISNEINIIKERVYDLKSIQRGEG